MKHLALLVLTLVVGCSNGSPAVDAGVGDGNSADQGADVPDLQPAPDAAVQQPTITRLKTIFEMSHGAAVAPSGRIFVADSYGRRDKTPRVYWLDPPYQGDLQQTPITGTVPAGLLWDQGLLYVCDVGANTITTHDAAFNPVHAVNVPMPWNVQVLPDKSLLVVTFDGKVLKVTGGAQTELLSGLENPFDIVLDGPGHFWVSEQGAEALKGGGVRRFALDGSLDRSSSFNWINPEGIARGPSGDIWVAETALNQVVRVAADGSGAAVFSGLTLPAVIAPFPDGDLLVITVRQETALYRIDFGP